MDACIVDIDGELAIYSTEFAEILDLARCILNQTGRVLRQDGGMGGAL
jgi:hypothetical protein